jgi:flagellar motor protein MotB
MRPALGWTAAALLLVVAGLAVDRSLDRLAAEQRRTSNQERMALSALASETKSSLADMRSAIEARLIEASRAQEGLLEVADRRDQVTSDRAPREDTGADAASQSMPVLAEAEIAVPGTSVSARGGTITVRFDSGLFSRDTALTQDAKAALTTLGRQLEPHACCIAVTVVGHGDNTPMSSRERYRDVAALSMARAVIAVDHLRETTGLPGQIFSAVGLGESDAPYPNDSEENARRNRTVVLRIERSPS